MPERGTAMPPVQAEQRHRIVLFQHLDRDVVDIGAVVRTQTARLETEDEEVRMEPVGVTAPVLVVLQLHQRGLGPDGEPGDHPRGGVGFLEVVDRSPAEELQDLLDIGLTLNERRHRRAPVALDQLGEASANGPVSGGGG